MDSKLSMHVRSAEVLLLSADCDWSRSLQSSRHSIGGQWDITRCATRIGATAIGAYHIR